MVKWLLRGFAVVCLLLLLVGGWVWWQLRTPPSWYDLADARSAPSADAAEQLEYTVAEEFHRIRETRDERWTMRLGEREINGWLASGQMRSPSSKAIPRTRSVPRPRTRVRISS